MRYVYVLDMNGKPLMPTCRYGKVRRMLKSGEAKVVDTLPFTIQLKYEPATKVVQPVVVGQDPGRTNIGMAAVRSDGTELYSAHVKTRNKDIIKLMAKRKAHRQASRRGERLARKRLAVRNNTIARNLEPRKLPGCEEKLEVKDIINTEARFNNRARPNGWLTPTATQLLRTHLNLFQKIEKILPVSDVVIEINKFAFMQLDNPEMQKKDIDFQRGPLYGHSGVNAAVCEQQGGMCLLCKKHEIEHYHHIVPRSKNGSNTMENIAGLCMKCHRKVHTDEKTADRLKKRKAGLVKKYGGLSVLNQIIPALVNELGNRYLGHAHVTHGWNTKLFRKEHGIEKTHDNDAYCIAASVLGGVKPNLYTKTYEIQQFRKYDRAIINNQRERTYRYDGRIIAKNRHKRFEQEGDSLEEWFNSMVELRGIQEAQRMCSQLTVQKSVRHYNTPNRIMPGAVFLYEGERYVLTGQFSYGQYFRAYGQDNRNFSAKAAKIIKKNEGLVYVA